MSVEVTYRFPFHFWTPARTAEALELLRAALPDVEVELDDDDDEAVVFERRETGGRVSLNDDDDPEGCAYAMIEAAHVDPTLLSDLNDAFDALATALGGACEPEGEAFLALCRAAERADALLDSFAEVQDWLLTAYELTAEEDVDLVQLVWGWTDTERTQLVFLETVEYLHEVWLQISSRAVPVDRVDARRMIELGGLANARIEHGAYWFVVTVPFGLSGTDVERLIGHVAMLADDLEEEILGTDEY